MNDQKHTEAFNHGRAAALRGCRRLLANPDHCQQEASWLEGFDSVPAEHRGKWPVVGPVPADLLHLEKKTNGLDAFESLIANAPEEPSAAPAPQNQSMIEATVMIPIREDEGQKTVDARDLHSFLQSGKDFSTWIKDRIEQFGFIEGSDFSPILGKSSGGRPSKEYALTLDMAKELSMVERTERGKKARQYFIACEKKLKSHSPMDILRDPAAMRGLLLDYSEQVIALQTTVSELKPQAEGLARISNADGDMCISTAAKVLQMRPKDLFHWLHSNQWIFRRGSEWLPYGARESQGVLEAKVTVVYRGDGSERTCTQTRVTSKGLAKLAEILSRKEMA